ncbi:hypothetical protein MKK58_17685 [Methylobacterium sp. J-078]|uniref:hypothetical protein n=1 Tax=Methylobacterium sp. J-078 TaxID=2836657 RepID=UPI001FBB433E|nr:hypothetical protein [Methylobacterium sp. J-078]MCJ2046350.1 hypothetical protein [Methylobacterium sp. J-078]
MPADQAKDDARLFARDALREARRVYADRAVREGEAMLATFAMLALAALFPDLLAEPEVKGTH